MVHGGGADITVAGSGGGAGGMSGQVSPGSNAGGSAQVAGGVASMGELGEVDMDSGPVDPEGYRHGLRRMF